MNLRNKKFKILLGINADDKGVGGTELKHQGGDSGGGNKLSTG